MAYEYLMQQAEFLHEDFMKGAMVDWLDALGAENWRVVQLKDGPGKNKATPSILVMGVFERKIEINETLRNAQLGIQPEPEPEPENES